MFLYNNKNEIKSVPKYEHSSHLKYFLTENKFQKCSFFKKIIANHFQITICIYILVKLLIVVR